MTRIIACVVFAAACTSSTPLGAQRTWPVAPARSELRLELDKSFYRPFATPDGVGVVSAGSAVALVGAILPVGQAIALSMDIGLSFERERVAGHALQATRIGNPWIGIELRPGAGFVVEAGVRPGLLGTDSTGVGTRALGNGVAADYDHYEAWLPGYHTARAGIAWQSRAGPGFFVGGLLGGSLGLSNGRSDDEDQDLYVLYGLKAGWRTERVVASLGFIGRGYLTATGPGSEPTVNQLVLETGAATGRIRPDASIRLYFDRLLRARSTAVVTLGATFAP